MLFSHLNSLNFLPVDGLIDEALILDFRRREFCQVVEPGFTKVGPCIVKLRS